MTIDPLIMRDVIEDICGTAYKIFTLSIGMFIVYLGYKLFVKNIVNNAGDLEGTYGKYKLILKKGAPGTFFALFGSFIIAFAVLKGMHFHSSETSQNSAPIVTEDSTASAPDLPPKPPTNEN